jgi:hypothetical protein
MLFINIITWEPDKAEEMAKRFAEKGTVTASKGGKAIGDWAAIGGGRCFRVVDVDDPKAMAAVANLWTDISKFEIIPIIEAKEFMKVLPSKK